MRYLGPDDFGVNILLRYWRGKRMKLISCPGGFIEGFERGGLVIYRQREHVPFHRLLKNHHTQMSRGKTETEEVDDRTNLPAVNNTPRAKSGE